MILFRVEFHSSSELKEQELLYLNRIQDVTDKERDYVAQRADKIIELLPQIDGKLDEISKGWKLDRLGKVELAILRLAIFEMNFDEDIPTNVALNEAVELAKTFGGDTSPSFINGVLGKLIEEEK